MSVAFSVCDDCGNWESHKILTTCIVCSSQNMDIDCEMDDDVEFEEIEDEMETELM